jgi:hypothetical protein
LNGSLAAVVQHVQVVEAAGLVRTEKVGRVRRCEINLDTLRPVDRWIADRRAMWERAFDQLGSVLGQQPAASTRSNEHPMTDRSVTHTTFVIERTYPVAPPAVFGAFADAELNERWFTMPPDWVDTEHTLDFRVGGP